MGGGRTENINKSHNRTNSNFCEGFINIINNIINTLFISVWGDASPGRPADATESVPPAIWDLADATEHVRNLGVDFIAEL